MRHSWTVAAIPSALGINSLLFKTIQKSRLFSQAQPIHSGTICCQRASTATSCNCIFHISGLLISVVLQFKLGRAFHCLHATSESVQRRRISGVLCIVFTICGRTIIRRHHLQVHLSLSRWGNYYRWLLRFSVIVSIQIVLDEQILRFLQWSSSVLPKILILNRMVLGIAAIPKLIIHWWLDCGIRTFI